MFIDKLISTTERSVPPGLGLATYCTWSNCFGGWKGRGDGCEIRHDGRVIRILGMDEDDVGTVQTWDALTTCSVKKIIAFSSQAHHTRDLTVQEPIVSRVRRILSRY